MNKKDKLNYLIENHFKEWINTRNKVELKVSTQNAVFCICGKLATGLHERSCRKFNDKVNSETIKSLEYLFKGK